MSRSVLTLVMVGLLVVGSTAIASAQRFRSMETREEAIQRHNAERYEHQERHGTPLGGYPERLGDPAPYGTSSPGFRSNSSGLGGSPYGPSDRNTYGPDGGRRERSRGGVFGD